MFNKIELIESEELMANVAVLEAISEEMQAEEEWEREYGEYLESQE